MVSFPPAKINLGLNVTEKRSDGFHNLETCFVALPFLSDALELIDSGSGEHQLEVLGVEWRETKESNLVWKAMQKFAAFEKLEPLHWILLKKIPHGGGLGGGSSDAAFALRLLAKRFQWDPTDPRLHEMAASIGSDCAFFLQNQTCFGTGRGEILEPISVSLSGLWVILVFPGIHISTQMAFSKIVPAKPAVSIPEILQQPIQNWRGVLENDFERSVFQAFPELAGIKENLYQAGALYASMTGSGSTLFGIFQSPPTLNWIEPDKIRMGQL